MEPRRPARARDLSRRGTQGARARAAWLEVVGLVDRADHLAGELPYGAQRRLEIARAMCTNPVLLCLDEPAAGLNNRESAELTKLLRGIRAQTGVSILLIEHDMSVVMDISDHVVVIEYGTKIADGTADSVKNDPKVIAAYLGVEDEELVAVARGADHERALADDLERFRLLRQHPGAQGRVARRAPGRDRDADWRQRCRQVDADDDRVRQSARAGGQILFEGRPITHLATHEIARLKISQAPEGRRIFQRMTVFENLQMGAAVDGGQNFDADLERVTTLFPRLKERLQQRGGRSPAASSRCSPSRARSWGGPSC